MKQTQKPQIAEGAGTGNPTCPLPCLVLRPDGSFGCSDALLELAQPPPTPPSSWFPPHPFPPSAQREAFLTGHLPLAWDHPQERWILFLPDQPGDWSRYRHLVEEMPIGLYHTTRDGRLLYANPTLLRILGFQREEDLLDQRVSDFFWSPEERDKQLARWAREGQGLSQDEIQFRRRDGKAIWVRDTGRICPSSESREDQFIGVLEDITEQKALMGRVQAAQKMESLGLLAGGMAHDFNNLLASILGHAHLLLQHADSDPASQRHLDAIIRNAEKAADLTSQMLGFAQGGTFLEVPLHFHNLVEETLRLVASNIPSGISTSLHLVSPEAPHLIRGDASQLKQVLIQLLLNARDAMPRGGHIRLLMTTSNAPPSVRLMIRDNGTGMPKSVMEHLFEPFFTTKPWGHGTGLGLAMAYGVVRSHRGQISVHSRPGKGTTVVLTLPQATPEGEPGPPAARTHAPS